MPRKPRSKYRYKKRRHNKRRDIVANLGNSPFPTTYLTKMRYVESITLDPGTLGQTDSELFTCNGLFNPNYTGTNDHQPLGYDELVVMYDHYTVLGSKITCTFTSASAGTSTGAAYCGIYINDDTSAVTTYDTIMEQGKGQHKLMTGNAAMGSCKVSHNFSSKKFFGVSDVKDNAQLKGSSGANPADVAYFVVYAQGLSTDAEVSPFYVTVQMDYIVQWSERRSLNQS